MLNFNERDLSISWIFWPSVILFSIIFSPVGLYFVIYEMLRNELSFKEEFAEIFYFGARIGAIVSAMVSMTILYLFQTIEEKWVRLLFKLKFL